MRDKGGTAVAAGVAARLNPDLTVWRDTTRFKGKRGRPFYCFCQRMKTVCVLVTKLTAVTLQFEICTTMGRRQLDRWSGWEKVTDGRGSGGGEMCSLPLIKKCIVASKKYQGKK